LDLPRGRGNEVLEVLAEAEQLVPVAVSWDGFGGVVNRLQGQLHLLFQLAAVDQVQKVAVVATGLLEHCFGLLHEPEEIVLAGVAESLSGVQGDDGD